MLIWYLSALHSRHRVTRKPWRIDSFNNNVKQIHAPFVILVCTYINIYIIPCSIYIIQYICVSFLLFCLFLFVDAVNSSACQLYLLFIVIVWNYRVFRDVNLFSMLICTLYPLICLFVCVYFEFACFPSLCTCIHTCVYIYRYVCKKMYR